MNIGLATAIFKQLENEKYSDEEKALAIYTVMNMPTHNSINKDYMLKAIKWLWDRLYEIAENGEREEPKKLTNFERIKQMTIEEFAKKFGDCICKNIHDQESYTDCTITECDDCLVDWLNQEAEQ